MKSLKYLCGLSLTILLFALTVQVDMNQQDVNVEVGVESAMANCVRCSYSSDICYRVFEAVKVHVYWGDRGECPE